MNGILCINKPQEYTSFDVIARLRGMSKTKRIGHAGTLDPMATGVLPIFFGKATKACDILPNHDKEYIAEFKFGIKTNTLDIFGEVISSKKTNVNLLQVQNVLTRFSGEIKQIPPMFSAVQVNGRRLYDMARQGIEIERTPRKAMIYSLELMNFDENLQSGTLRISCGKGTYVRTLCDDIGKALDVDCVMGNLERVKSGNFLLKDCYTLEQVQELVRENKLEQTLMPIDSIFINYPLITLNEIQSKMFKNGVELDLNRVIYKDIDGCHRVYDNNNVFLGLASLNIDEMALKIEKMFIDN
ncbi:MAG: tRNA pseudouridine(55) synthase TruB [Oscillospiraceae bacterium]